MDFKKLATQYKDELMNHILPFWLECSQYSHQLAGGIYRKMNILQDVLIAKTDGQILHSEHYRVSLPGFIIR